jgi:hypothetical protein
MTQVFSFVDDKQQYISSRMLASIEWCQLKTVLTLISRLPSTDPSFVPCLSCCSFPVQNQNCSDPRTQMPKSPTSGVNESCAAPQRSLCTSTELPTPRAPFPGRARAEPQPISDTHAPEPGSRGPASYGAGLWEGRVGSGAWQGTEEAASTEDQAEECMANGGGGSAHEVTASFTCVAGGEDGLHGRRPPRAPGLGLSQSVSRRAP